MSNSRVTRRSFVKSSGIAAAAAGTGARIALLNFPSRLEIGEILPKVEKVETAHAVLLRGREPASTTT